MDPASPRLESQLEFLLELDRLKTVLRRTLLLDQSRNENSAEHSWHLAMMALILEEYALERISLGRVLKMLLVHDVVEIDAGDTYCYDPEANQDKRQREHAAAERIFGLLPAEQGDELHALWREFEARESADARFANALDRLQPLLHNYLTSGRTWLEHGVRRSQVVERNEVMADGAPELWEYARRFIEEAVARGYLAED